jgi:hypothetical protein
MRDATPKQDALVHGQDALVHEQDALVSRHERFARTQTKSPAEAGLLHHKDSD